MRSNFSTWAFSAAVSLAQILRALAISIGGRVPRSPGWTPMMRFFRVFVSASRSAFFQRRELEFLVDGGRGGELLPLVVVEPAGPDVVTTEEKAIAGLDLRLQLRQGGVEVADRRALRRGERVELFERRARAATAARGAWPRAASGSLPRRPPGRAWPSRRGAGVAMAARGRCIRASPRGGSRSRRRRTRGSGRAARGIPGCRRRGIRRDAPRWRGRGRAAR